jgi:hypothetical protein
VRFESSVTSISWLPADAVKGLASLPFDIGSTDFDAPPPHELAETSTFAEAISALSFRFANRLAAWAEVSDDGEIVEAGYGDGGHTGRTFEHGDRHRHLFIAAPLPDVQPPPAFGDGFVRFEQSVGVHGGTPVPRALRRAPFVQWRVPLTWTTLSLTMHVDGTATHELVGASRVPRHWIYNAEGNLVSRTGLVDVDDWYRTAFDEHTPWGDVDSRTLAARVESSLLRRLSQHVTSEIERPRTINVAADTTLVRQGDTSSSVFLVLDGSTTVVANGKRVAEYGPGALFGEGAALEGSARAVSLVTATKSRLAVIAGGALDRDLWDHLASGQRRAESNVD